MDKTGKAMQGQGSRTKAMGKGGIKSERDSCCYHYYQFTCGVDDDHFFALWSLRMAAWRIMHGVDASCVSQCRNHTYILPMHSRATMVHSAPDCWGWGICRLPDAAAQSYLPDSQQHSTQGDGHDGDGKGPSEQLSTTISSIRRNCLFSVAGILGDKCQDPQTH